jgi:hypothetical protein
LRKNLWFAERNENPGRGFRESRRRARAPSKLSPQKEMAKGKGDREINDLDSSASFKHNRVIFTAAEQ